MKGNFSSSSLMLMLLIILLSSNFELIVEAGAQSRGGSGGGAKKYSHVISLGDSNFEIQTANGEWLLEFYAPWCGHCKRLAPIYEETARKLKEKDSQVHVAKIDCTANKMTCSRFGIRSFPTLKFLAGGNMYDYRGSRAVNDLLNFAEGGWRSSNSNPMVSFAFLGKQYHFSFWWIIGGAMIGGFVGITMVLFTCCILMKNDRPLTNEKEEEEEEEEDDDAAADTTTTTTTDTIAAKPLIEKKNE